MALAWHGGCSLTWVVQFAYPQRWHVDTCGMENKNLSYLFTGFWSSSSSSSSSSSWFPSLLTEVISSWVEMAVSLLDRSGQFSSAASNFRILRVLEAKTSSCWQRSFTSWIFMNFRSHVLGFGAIFGSLFFGKSSDAFLMWNSGIFRITRLVKARDGKVFQPQEDLIRWKTSGKKGFVRNRWMKFKRILEAKKQEGWT